MKVELNIEVADDELTDGLLTGEQVDTITEICSDFMEIVEGKMRKDDVDAFSIDFEAHRPKQTVEW